jgi:hypothetical protein
MDLDDLKQRWEDQDRKLDAILRLNTRLLQAPALSKAETAMRRLSRLLQVELLLNFGMTLVLGSFLGDHGTEARFLIPAVVLDLCVILHVVAGIHQLIALGKIDYSAPVLMIQKRMESLRAQRLRATMLTLLVAPLLWTPLLIVALKGLLGIDAYATLPGDWLAANLLFGLAVIPLAIWMSRRYADRMAGSPLVQRLMRDLAGYNLSAAAGFLSSLERFEEEGGV